MTGRIMRENNKVANGEWRIGVRLPRAYIMALTYTYGELCEERNENKGEERLISTNEIKALERRKASYRIA